MRIGILGGGQLARMLALAGHPLGQRFRVLDPVADAPAAAVAEHLRADYRDQAALARFAEGCDAVTYEFENVPDDTAAFLAARLPVLPPPRALTTSQDRKHEKEFFARLGIPLPGWAAVGSRAELDAAVARLGLPAVLKTRRFGYDGRGQAVLREPADVESAWRELGSQPLVLEAFVRFTRELSLIGVRGRTGETAFYPLVENLHRAGILRRSLAPAPDTGALQARAEGYGRACLDALGYVGVLAVEFFAVDGGLVANEMAPRVHNSGHWTIEGAECSQFENHLRAVAGLPLGSTAPRGVSAMLNLIGAAPDPAQVLAVPGARLHLYGKEPRPGRKLGHITLCADSAAALAERVERLERLLTP